MMIRLSRIAFALLAALLLAGGPGRAVGQDGTVQPLSLDELQEARQLLLSRDIDYGQRVDLASKLAIHFEQRNQPGVARRWCLDFAASAAPLLESATQPPAVADMETWRKLADTIHQGDYPAATKAIRAAIQNNSLNGAGPIAMVMSLKADDMISAYTLLYQELANRKRTPYLDYMLGILAAREQRLSEAKQLLDHSLGQLIPPRLEAWLNMDRAKLATVMGDYDEAEGILKDLVAQNPKDPQVLYLNVLLEFARDQKDQARRHLTQMQPLLRPDPYLLAQTATLAIRLNEIETAAKILETFEAQVPPNRDFYEAFALLRKAQGRSEDSDAYQKKALQLKETRVSVGAAQEKTLADAIESVKQNASVTALLDDVAPAARAYLNLLEGQNDQALSVLTTRIDQQKAEPFEYIMAATMLRRIYDLMGAEKTLVALRTRFGDFQPYAVLSMLSDLSVRLGDMKNAKIRYRELRERFPDSYQADAANRFFSDLDRAEKAEPVSLSMRVSPMLTRYSQYSAAFALSEIMNYWDEDTNFAKVNAAIGTSAKRGLGFHELIPVILSGARLQITPFIPTFAAVQEFVDRKIPVLYCQGDLFGEQTLDALSLVNGADPIRKIVYAENVRADEFPLLTEQEMLGGIALAVHPGTVKPPETPVVERAVEMGRDYLKWNLEAVLLAEDDNRDPAEFKEQMDEAASKTGPEWIPLQMGFARWVLRRGSYEEARAYLDRIAANCGELGEYRFFIAHMAYSRKEYDGALQAAMSALGRRPGAIRWELGVCRILSKTGQVAEAVQRCEKLSRQHPENLLAASYLLTLYQQTGAQDKIEQEKQRLKTMLNVEALPIDIDQQDKEEL
ncbi:MAG: tetratricopeptide repeat protein [bacterium]|nr:tetratricopeptide repeat protein [bacterium]